MKLIQGRKKLYDGLETPELYDSVFLVYEHAFPVQEMLRNKFPTRKGRLNESDFLELIETSGTPDSKESENSTEYYEKFRNVYFDGIENYQSADGLAVYYSLLNDSLLYLFSFGEVQPGRYLLFSESVWRIESSHRFQGNMGEPDTVSSFIMMFGVDPRTGQLPIKTLKQLHDTLIAKGCNRFYINAENSGLPQNSGIPVLDCIDGNWVVSDGTATDDKPIFTTKDQDEAIVFYYKHIMSAKDEHPVLIESATKISQPTVTEIPTDNSEFPLDNGYFPEIKSHDSALFNKQLQQLFWLTSACGLMGVILKLVGSEGFGGLFYFLFWVVLIWSVVFWCKQDHSKSPFKVTPNGLFINQQFIRNAFVPWENISKAELRGYSDVPSIVLTFADVKTLLKEQFFILRSVAKAQLTPNATMVISGFETESDLKQTFAIIKHYLPKGKNVETLHFNYETGKPPSVKIQPYIRLENNRTQSYYRQILDEALQQAEYEFRRSPNLSLNESFFNQLTDIKKTVIEQGVVYTESEADQRYTLGIMAVRNFDGYPDNWDYPKKLIDVSSGISHYHQMPENQDFKLNLNDELNEIKTAFGRFFAEHQFQLKSSAIDKVVYHNSYAELVFDFDNYGMRWGYIAPAAIFYRNNSSQKVYSLKQLIQQFHNIDFDLLFNEYFIEKRLGYYESLNQIVITYAKDSIGNADFSWEKDFKDN